MDLLSLAHSIEYFLAEDIGSGDITTQSIFDGDQAGEAVFVAKDAFMVAGIETVAPLVFTARNRTVACTAVQDGSLVAPGDVLLRARGPVQDLLTAERVALNLAQRLSGIATLTSRFVEQVKQLPVKIVDTRKTTPGLRMLEKYAVRIGGGCNHRFNLADGILIKDNHIAACGSIAEAVRRVRRRAPHTLRIEVEAETLDQVRSCLSCNVDIIMLDNMDPATMREAVKIARGKVLLEVSGGVTLETVQEIAETGVDLISIGALTHSAPACDISMRLSQ